MNWKDRVKNIRRELSALEDDAKTDESLACLESVRGELEAFQAAMQEEQPTCE